MLTPDSKDWTWVLNRPCPECGFDASTCDSATVSGLVRANAREWAALFAQGSIAAGRPDPATWSSLEYACHVRDVYRRYDERIAAMLEQEDPLFANWDQDASAILERYEEQEPALVVADLLRNAAALVDRLDGLAGSDWARPGRRSDGASFTVDSLARYMIHDPVHHVWDVRSA
jgi:hypothetical protein